MLTRLRNFLVDNDMYGQPISLLYQGKGTFNTGLGGIFSLLTVLIILGYLAKSSVKVFKNEYELSNKYKVLNEFKDNSIYTLTST
mmetsp:Transcript_33997/g.25087  ORF Transcript_33997/g.25087 Transcript_33997/m.25087 type:complete len:85 (+) Transcript_33997:56-310(+)